jgi:hypothetical protein
MYSTVVISVVCSLIIATTAISSTNIVANAQDVDIGDEIRQLCKDVTAVIPPSEQERVDIEPICPPPPPPPEECPPGTIGTPPNCEPEKCPPGTIGTPPNCVIPPPPDEEPCFVLPPDIDEPTGIAKEVRDRLAEAARNADLEICPEEEQ